MKGVLNYCYIPVRITEYQRQKVYLGIVTKHKKSPLVSRCLSFCQISFNYSAENLLIPTIYSAENLLIPTIYSAENLSIPTIKATIETAWY